MTLTAIVKTFRLVDLEVTESYDQVDIRKVCIRLGAWLIAN